MTPILSISLRLIFAVALPALVGAFASARAQDEEEEEFAPVQAQILLHPMAIIHVENAGPSIYGAPGAGQPRAQLEAALLEKLEDADRDYALTADQKKKLLLAGQGDIKHFLDEAEEADRSLKRAASENDRAALNDSKRQIGRLHLRFARGLFTPGSLFAKTLPKTITREQLANHDEAVRKFEAARYKESVAISLGKLVRVLDLSTDQHQQLAELMLTERPAPRKSGQSSHAYVMYQMSQIPKEKLQPLLQQPQWEMLDRLLRAWKDARPFLENDGFVFSDDPPVAPRAAQPAVPLRRGFTGQ
jgi:hypothetical protein